MNICRRFSATLGFFAPIFCAGRAQADWAVNLPQGVTAISRSVYDLHMLIFYICLAIAVVVFGVMFWSIFHHRKSRGHKAVPFHENTFIEVIWTLIPFLILGAMAVPATKTLVAMYDVSDSDLDVQVTGYQWKWRYQYLNHDLDFFSNLTTTPEQINNLQAKSEHYLLEVDRPLVIPANRKVRLLLTSNDVIHSWWVPDLAVKKDAIPGFINEAWTRVEEPGIYRGQCTELCGKDHGFMPVVVEVKSEADFQAWLLAQLQAKQADAAAAEREWTFEELMAEGERVYLRSCAGCHQQAGMGVPGVFPALKDSPLVLGPIEQHLAVVMEGRKGTAMPGFAEQLSPQEMAAVVTYERNAWGNDKGDWLAPRDVKSRLAE